MRIIISSATIDAGMFKDFFERGEKEKEGDKKKDEVASVISLEGRTFPVDVMYLDEPCEDYIEMAIKTVLDIHLKVLFLYILWLLIIVGTRRRYIVVHDWTGRN